MRRVASALAGLVLAAGLTTTGMTAQAATTEKLSLTGPSAVLYCYNLEPYPGEVVGGQVDGFALFKENKGKLSVVLQVKNVRPNTDYVVRLIQAAGAAGYSDCHKVDLILHTNKQGIGTVTWNEPVTGSRAQVIIDTGSLYGDPTYRATEFFTIP